MRPELVLIMRHAKLQGATTPSEIGNDELHEEAEALLTDAGSALAETFHELQRPTGVRPYEIRFVHEKTAACRLTVETLHEAYEAARKARWNYAPPSGGMAGLETDPISPFEGYDEVMDWLQDVQNELRDIERLPIYRLAVVVVGHDPRVGWLLSDLTERSRARSFWSPGVPGLTYAEMVACELDYGKQRYLQVWALSPTDSPAEDEVRAKIKSKMDTAKVFAGVVAAVLAFVASGVDSLDGRRQIVATTGLAMLGLAAILYLVTMFRYDSLLMPKRFWAVRAPQERPPVVPATVLKRPPSSSTLLLYQNMIIVWSRSFVPATIAAGVGLALYVAALSRPTDLPGWVALTGAVIVMGDLAVAFTLWSRSQLGVQD